MGKQVIYLHYCNAVHFYFIFKPHSDRPARLQSCRQRINSILCRLQQVPRDSFIVLNIILGKLSDAAVKFVLCRKPLLLS